MDKMDIDLVEVPDTPDRSTTRVILEKSCPKEKKHIPSIPCHSAHHKFHEEGPRGRPIDIGSGSKRLFLRFPKCTSSSSSSLHPKKTKGVIEPNNSYQPQDSVHTQPVQIERPSCKSSSSYQNDTPVDLTDRVMHRPKKVSSLSGNDGERTDNTSRVGSTIGSREGVELVSNVQIIPGNNGFLSPDSIPRLNRQKKLVRNGCISPNNIAKAKELSGKESNSSVAVAQNNNASTESIDIMDLVAEDKHSYKGKGKAVLCQPCPSVELDSKNKHCLSRSSRSFCDKPKETKYHNWGLGTSIEEPDGWISTRNRPRKKTSYLSDEEQVVGQQHRTGTGRTEKGSSVPTSGDCPKDPKIVSSQHTQPLRLPESNPKTRLRQLNGHQTKSTHVRRPKPEFADDPEVVLLSSPGEPSTSRSISRRVNNPQLIIKVDNEFVPELRHSTEAEDARVRQLEADDRLARLLQEELYNEMPDPGAAMSDEQIALLLQHLDGSARASSRSNHPVSDARGFSNLPRRGSQSRASTLGRMTRLRSRFPGQPRTVLPSRGRTSRVPVNMDIDMRMHILGAMEAFSDMGVGPDILQTQRDFTENDYEILLALDENNDRHAGASARLINGLPQSTIQSNTPVETCAICLETPTVGDSIRHLPCLHKFHKDCIDPWLRRRTSCPVCKSSIT